VSWSLTRTEQRPPITSRFMPSVSWPLVTGALMGRTSDPQVIIPDALNEPPGRPGKVTFTLPLLGLVPTVPEAWAPKPAGQGMVLENACPVTVTAAEAWPTGVTTTVGT
jgi:hypothetical protein